MILVKRSGKEDDGVVRRVWGGGRRRCDGYCVRGGGPRFRGHSLPRIDMTISEWALSLLLTCRCDESCVGSIFCLCIASR